MILKNCTCGMNSGRLRDHKYPCPVGGDSNPITWWHANWDSDYIPLYRCSRCAALVGKEGKEHHENWHLHVNEEWDRRK